MTDKVAGMVADMGPKKEMADIELDRVADKGVDKVANMVVRTISLFGKGLLFDFIQFSITSTT